LAPFSKTKKDELRERRPSTANSITEARMINARSVAQKLQLVGAVIILLVLAFAAGSMWSAWEGAGLSENATASAPVLSSAALPVLRPELNNGVREFGPAYLLQLHARPLPELKAWATDWQSETSMGGSQLAGLIANSDLSAIECLQIGVMISHDEGYSASKVWIEAGYHRADVQFADLKNDRESARSLISALTSAQDHLQGRANAALLLEHLNSLIVRFGRQNDWDQTPEWARLHHADALLLEGRNVEAKSEADAMSKEAATDPHWGAQLKSELKLLVARIPFEPEAKSPFDILVNHRPQPDELLAWMKIWQTNHLKHQTDEERTATELDRPELLEMIGKSDLSAMEGLRISDLLTEAGDQLDAETFASVGADRAVAELTNIRIDDPAARPLLNALKRVEDRLWESPASENSRGVTLEQITSVLMRFNRENSWDQTPEWARIGHGEALFMQQRYSEALAEANQLAKDARTDPYFTDEQRGGIEWLQAMVFFNNGRYQEAIPHLAYTATHTALAHSKDAWPMWAVSLAKSGDSEQANRIFDNWIQRDRPSVDIAAHIMEVIQGQATN
jgi:tetratricopeptide (TPR) repeat protein